MDDVKVKTGFGGMRALPFAGDNTYVERLCEPVSLVSFFLIASLTIAEFMEYRKVTMKPAIVVDKSRGEKLVVNLNVTFPRVPCYRACLRTLCYQQLDVSLDCTVLSVDIMDISGEHQNGSFRFSISHASSHLVIDVNHDMTKTRLDKTGVPLNFPGAKGPFAVGLRSRVLNSHCSCGQTSKAS